MDRFWILTLLCLTVSVMCCSAQKKDGDIGQAKRQLSRHKRSHHQWNYDCNCPGSHRSLRLKTPARLCPCDGISLSLAEQPRHRRHSHGYSRQYRLNHQRQNSRKFLHRRQKHPNFLKGLQIPL